MNLHPRLNIGNLGILGKFEVSEKLSRHKILALLRIHIEIQQDDIFYTYKRCMINSEVIHSPRINE